MYISIESELYFKSLLLVERKLNITLHESPMGGATIPVWVQVTKDNINTKNDLNTNGSVQAMPIAVYEQSVNSI